MKTEEKERIKELLLEELEKTEKEVENYRQSSKPVAPDNAIGRVSRMDAINNRSVMEAALAKAKNRLKALKIAFNNLNEPDFGLCRRCKNPIPVARILLLPHSSFCVNCAS